MEINSRSGWRRGGRCATFENRANHGEADGEARIFSCASTLMRAAQRAQPTAADKSMCNLRHHLLIETIEALVRIDQSRPSIGVSRFHYADKQRHAHQLR